MSDRVRARVTHRAGFALLAALSLAFTGLPTSALALETALPSGPMIPSAGAPGTIEGAIVLPAGVSGVNFDVDFYAYDGSRWRREKYVASNPDGSFAIAGLNDGQEYRVHLDSYADGYLGGFYAGPGAPLEAEPEFGAAVYSPSSDLQIVPVKTVEISGVINLPPGFDWMDLGTSQGFDISAREFNADGDQVLADRLARVEESPDGRFVISGVRPGVVHLLSLNDDANRFLWGYHHAGATGLVSGVESATPVMAGATGVEITVGPTRGIARMSALSTPTVSGTAVVGSTLSAKPGAWSLHLVGFSYQWLRNGAAISGATAPTYTLGPADAGTKVSVRVSASKGGFASAAATSAPTTAVAKAAAPRVTTAPAVKGSARLGKTLRATAGSWSLPGATYSYQWLRDGKVIKGATAARYALKKKDVRKRISVRVTASVPGHVAGVVASSSTKVAKGKPKVTVKVKAKKKVTSAKRAKLVVRVKAAGLAKPTGKVIVKYGKKTVKAKLVAKRKGKVVVRLPKLARGKYKVTVTYKPNTKSKKFVTKAKSKKVTLRVR